ncbi:MAG TPA: alpha/beta fold hydrolase [Anaerolineales bacterium]|nr:alpha/beta fold hydrolase [Anaerolineales bacterium]
MKTPKRRGLRYWVILLLLGGLWAVLFFQNYLAMRRGFNLWQALWALVLLYLGTALWQAYRDTSPARFPLTHTDPEVVGFSYEEIEFKSRDGLALAGWFVAPKNGATIILSHSFGANRQVVLPLAQLLEQHGYGLLLYDMRAHGRSQGSLGTWGWLEVNDIFGAVDYLLTRSEVNPRQVGAMGFSLGGQVVLRAAIEDDRIGAAAADGPSVAAVSDHVASQGLSLRKLIFAPWLWLIYNSQVLLTGATQPPGVVQAIGRLAPRPLLIISTGSGFEQHFARRIYDAAGEPKTLFEMPEARHGDGLNARPEEYEARVTQFFDTALGIPQDE